MDTSMRKKLSIILSLIICIISNITHATATTSETAVIGSITPTIINVSAPAKVIFSIDPNIADPDQRFTSSNIHIMNESNAAVKVKISKGQNNFILTSDSSWKPLDVLPDEYYWQDIGTKESESYIAIGIKIDKGNWKRVLRPDALYVSEQHESAVDIVFGEIQRNSDAFMKLICHHGSSFGESKECSYRIIWSFSIGD
jgi:hypothetical protein